jgi:hypothetical protein
MYWTRATAFAGSFQETFVPVSLALFSAASVSHIAGKYCNNEQYFIQFFPAGIVGNIAENAIHCVPMNWQYCIWLNFPHKCGHIRVSELVQ